MSGNRTAIEGAPRSDFANIPLPPESGDEEPAAPAPSKPPRAAALDFIEPQRLSQEFPFQFGFRLDGREVRSFTARRLLLWEVGALVERLDPKGEIDVIELYAVMTGLPAEVIRGLEADDGAMLAQSCRPFFPRDIRALISLVTRESGDATG